MTTSTANLLALAAPLPYRWPELKGAARLSAFQAIHLLALEWARVAALACPDGAYCGFAWVHIPDGRHPFARWARHEAGYRKHWSRGVYLWSPAGMPTQSMDVQEAGARAYASCLQTYGIEAFMGSRPD